MTTWAFFSDVSGVEAKPLCRIANIEIPRNNELVVVGGIEHHDPEQAGGERYRVTRVWWLLGSAAAIANVEMVKVVK